MLSVPKNMLNMLKNDNTFSPHALGHIFMGLGLGLLLATLFPSVYHWSTTLGVLLTVTGFLLDVAQNRRKNQ